MKIERAGDKLALITVVIPLYNKERQIERAIRSVQQQTFQDWRLIVVNDGSTDNGPGIVRNIRDDRIEVIDQKNAGPGAARNTGIKMTKTTYVTFLDADDEWLPEFLEATLASLINNDVVLAATPLIELPMGYNTVQLLYDAEMSPGVFWFRGDEDPQTTRVILSLIQAKNSVMLRTTALKYGCFYEEECKYGEDSAFLWRIGFSERFMIIGRALAYYHMEDSELGPHVKARPLEPYLRNPRVLLDYCPSQNHNLIKAVLDVLVLRRIINQAHYGLRLQSFFLLLRYPGARRYNRKFNDCLKRITPGYTTWCKIKNRLRSLNKMRVTNTSEKKRSK